MQKRIKSLVSFAIEKLSPLSMKNRHKILYKYNVWKNVNAHLIAQCASFGVVIRISIVYVIEILIKFSKEFNRNCGTEIKLFSQVWKPKNIVLLGFRQLRTR